MKFLRFQAGDAKHGQCDALKSEFPARGVIPFVECVSAAASSTGAQRNSWNSYRQWNVGVGGGSLAARTVTKLIVTRKQSGQQWRILNELARWSHAQNIHFQSQYVCASPPAPF